MRVACIGSRNLRADQLELCEWIGRRLVERGNQVVTGGARGADQAFMRGAASVDASQLTVHVPWTSYEAGSRPTRCHVTSVADDVTSREIELAGLHPAYDRLGQGAQKLMWRNARIVLDCEVVIAWPRREGGQILGGTVHGMTVAKHLGKRVYDLSLETVRESLTAKLSLETVRERLKAKLSS